LRAFVERAGFPGLASPTEVGLEYHIGKRPIRVVDHGGQVLISPAERASLQGLLESSNDRALELAEGLFEGWLARGRLPNTPLVVTHLEFGEPIFPIGANGRPSDVALEALSECHLPMRAWLYNLPGAPVNWLLPRWDSKGELAGVRFMAEDSELDPKAAEASFALRYGPQAAVGLADDLEALGREGRRLGLALLSLPA
jgi:hypothetical protein